MEEIASGTLLRIETSNNNMPFFSPKHTFLVERHFCGVQNATKVNLLNYNFSLTTALFFIPLN